MATPLRTKVFWRNKETVLQYEGQNPEPVTFETWSFISTKENSKNSSLEVGKHRKVTMAKVSDQKPDADSSQLLLASHVASQVPCEPKSPLPKQMWRPKQKALYEAQA